jgi:hypothetical protein
MTKSSIMILCSKGDADAAWHLNVVDLQKSFYGTIIGFLARAPAAE